MKRRIPPLLALAALLALSSCGRGHKEPVDYVNPYIGNISHLLVPTYPTVHLPNSMLRVYPERADYTTDQIRGLPVMVTSHRGSSAFNISPMAGAEKDLPAVKNYSYDLEKIAPYRYSVYLTEEQVAVSYAPSHRSGIYRLRFEQDSGSCVVVNSRNGELAFENGGLHGYQIIDGGQRQTKVYLYLEAEQAPHSSTALSNGAAVALRFKEREVALRYGVSFISSGQARENLRREIGTYSVDEVAQAGRKVWNEALGKIRVEGSDEDMKTVFYTSLYRTCERMINLSEDGQYYSAADGAVHSDSGVPFYTDDWIWDTYRATHPLRILLDPDMEEAMIASYIRMAQQSREGWMPTFPEVTGDSHRMNGNHAVAVIWDAYSKGLRGTNLEAAYRACRGAIREKSLLPWTKVPNTELDDFYWEKGYYPALRPNEKESCKAVHPFEKRQSIGVMLGNAYDCWCLAEIARALGKEEDYRYFLKAAYSYRNVFNPQTAFFHPKDRHGKFIEPFDYRYSGGQGAREYYSENNGWIYRWDVPHNVADLVNLMGGREKFAANLDEMFRTPLGRSKFDFYATLPDHTGNVGQFSMANEPSMHIPYLYNYAGQPWKTQHRISKLLREWFRNDLMGVPGDEDGGGLATFVVFSALGFYPVTPGMPAYNIGSPAFAKSALRLGNGKTFTIEAKNQSANNKYIQSATLNGQAWDKPWFSHDDVMKGGKLVLVMGSKPNYQWGAAPESAPPSLGVPK